MLVCRSLYINAIKPHPDFSCSVQFPCLLQHVMAEAAVQASGVEKEGVPPS